MNRTPRPRAAAAALATLAAAALALGLAACSAGGAQASARSAPAESAAFGELRMAMEKEAAPASAKPAAPGQAAKPSESTRKRIVTGFVDLQVANLAAAVRKVGELAAPTGAWFASTQVEGQWATLVIRVPADKYDALVAALSGAGSVVRSGTQVEDVSEQWFDLDNRLRAKRILLERYLNYLRQAKNTEDLLAIERQVSDTTSEIEQLEGSFRRLNDQVANSTLTVNLSLPGTVSRDGFDLGGALADFGENVLDVLAMVFMALLYVVAIGAPLVLLAAGTWLVLFGKIGLVRKLFARVRAAQTPSPPEKPVA